MYIVSALARTACIVSLLLVMLSSAQGATPSTWDGANSNWSSTTHWSTNPFFPDNGNGAPTYDATINSGVVNLDVDVDLSSLSIKGGTLSGAGSLTADQVTLSGGTLATTGAINSSHIDLGGVNLDRNLTLSIGSHSIENLNVVAGRTLTNDTLSTLTANTGAGETQAFGAGTFINKGTFIKNGVSRSYMSISTANNEGDVQVQSSALRFDQVGNHTGTFEISNGAQLELSGTQDFASTATISGQGTLRMLGGTVSIDSDVSVGLFRMNGGTLSGSGNLSPTSFAFEAGTLDRDLSLTSGSHTIGNLNVVLGRTLTNDTLSTLRATTGLGESQAFGAGTLVNKGTLIKDGVARSYLSMGTVNNEGDVQVQSSALRLDHVGNHTGTFEISNGAQLELSGTQDFASTATISGPGTLRMLGGTVSIDSDVSVGLFRMNGGTLSGSGMLSPTSFAFEAGTLDRDLLLTTGNHTIGNLNVALGRTLTNDSLSTLMATTGAGESQAFGAGTFVNKGTLIKNGASRSYMSVSTANNEGKVQVQSSAIRFDQNGDHTGTFEIAAGAQLELGGKQNLAPSASITGAGTLVMLSGTTTIDSDVDVGIFRLNSGTLKGIGNLSATSFVLEGATLDRDLTLTSGSNTIANTNVAVGRTLTNDTLSTLSATTGAGETQAFGAGTFINKGTFIKNGSSRTYMSVSEANNEGVVQVQSSALRFDQIGHHTGTFEVSAAGQLEFAGTQFLAPSATISGLGKVVIVGGNVVFDSHVSASLLRVNSGILSGNGTIDAPTTIETFMAGISAGDGVGTITFDSDLTLAIGSRVIWELGALETSNSGVSWDQIIITGGDLALASANYLDVHLLGADFSPITGNPFWSTSQRWEKIINLTGDASDINGTPQFLIDNGSWSRAGSFSVEASIDGRGLDLVWTSVPEPSSMILSGVAVIACLTYAARANMQRSGKSAARVG